MFSKNKLLVLLQGIPGCGKSLLAKQVKLISGPRCHILEGDQYKRNTNLCQEKLREYLGDERVEIVIFDRNNANFRQYKDYLEIAKTYNCRVLNIFPAELINDKKELFIDLCVETVQDRVGHQTMDKLASEKREELVRLGAKQFRPAETSQGIDFRYKIETCLPPSTLGDQTVLIRRDIKRIACEVVGYITEGLSGIPDPLSIVLPINSEFKQELISKVSGHFTPKCKVKTLFNEITLITSGDNLDDKWFEVKKRVGRQVNIVVTKLITRKRGTAILMCRISSKKGKDLTGLVFSGCPHIIGMLPEKTDPAITNQMIKDEDYDRVYPLEGLETSARITFVY